MTKQEILAAAGYPNTPEGIAAFYEEYGTPDAFFAKHGGSLSGAPHDGQPTADQFFNYGSHVNDKLNIPMSNPYFLEFGGSSDSTYDNFQHGGSIVNYLASKNQDYSKEARKKLAEKMGVKDYDFSAEKNTELLNLLISKESNKPSKPTIIKAAASDNKDKMKQFLSKTKESSNKSYQPKKDSKVPKVKKEGDNKPTIVKNYNLNTNYNIPSESTGVKAPLIKLPSKKEQKNAPKVNTDNISVNGKKLPSSGVVIDKRGNQAYYFGDQGQTGTFPVLTGKNPNRNANVFSMEDLESNPMLRNTPAGYYIMDVPEVDKASTKANKDYYNYLMKDYAGKVRNLNPISAFGVPAPIAADLGFHRSYSSNAANPNDAEYKRREALYSKDPKMRCTSFGCVNAQDASYDEIYKAFPTRDTLLVLDPNNADDLRLLEIAKRKIESKEKGGAYYGGPIRPYKKGGLTKYQKKGEVVNPWQTPGATNPDNPNFIHSTTPGTTRWLTKEGKTPFQELLSKPKTYGSGKWTAQDTLIQNDPRLFNIEKTLEAKPEYKQAYWGSPIMRDLDEAERAEAYMLTYGDLRSLINQTGTAKGSNPDPYDQMYYNAIQGNESGNAKPVSSDVEKKLRFYSKAKKYGGDITEFCWGGGLPGGPNEMPEMLHGGYHSPMNYGSFPVTSEWGGALDFSNRDSYPMMEDGGNNLVKIIKAASKKMKKAYASGGNTTIQGGNQNFLENRNNAFTNSIKNNVYNAFIKEEEKAAMQALNPYATGMEDMDQTYQAKKGKQKEPDDVPVDFRKALPDLFPVGRDYSRYIPANIYSEYGMSNADYIKMQELNKRLADKTFQLNKDGFEGTPEWGPLARMLGKTGQRMFGPKSVTYKFTGRGVKQVPVKDTELNLPGFEKKVTSGTPTSLMDDYYNQGSTEYEDTAGISDIKNLPKEKEPQYKYRNLNRPPVYNEDGFGTEYEDRANYSDQNIQTQPQSSQSVNGPSYLQFMNEEEPALPDFFPSRNKQSMQNAMNNSVEATNASVQQMKDQGIKPENKKNNYGYTLDDYIKDKLRYEATSGSALGKGLSDFGYHSSQLPLKKQDKNYKFKQPSIAKAIKDKNDNIIGYEPTDEELQNALDLYRKEIIPQIDYFGDDPGLIGRSADFLFNTGRDPRVYMMDQYLRSEGKTGIPDRQSYNVDTKTNAWTPELESKMLQQWKQYQPEIAKLPREKQIELLDQARDWYYQNINRKNNQPSTAYEKTWKGRIEGDKKYKKYGGILGKYQGGGLTQEQYDNLMNLYNQAATASQTNKSNPETLAFQQAFHSYQPTKQIAEGLLSQRQAANQPTALGRTLGKDKMYSLASNEDQYFGKTTQQYLAELQKLNPSLSSSTPQAQPAPVTGYKPTLTDMNVPDTGLDLNFKAPSQKPAPLNTGAGLQEMNVPDTGMNSVSLASSSATTPTQSKADIINKAKGMDMRKLKPELNLDDKGRKELIGPTDTEVGPEETITSKINRKTKGIGKAIGQYAPGVANAWASILEQQDKMDPMQNHPVVLPDEGDYDINTGDYRVRRKVPVQFPGGIGAYRTKFGGALPQALSGLEVKMQPGLYGTNGNRQFTLPTQVNSQKFSQQPTEVRNTLLPVAREGANLEAEKGETALVNIDGIPAHFKIGGQRHHSGGTPLNLPDNSFIFSDTASMKIKDPYVLAQFGMAPKKSGYTPAEIAKKYDINKFRKILADPNSEDLERKTAEQMIANYNMKLAKLSLVQESIKGFPQGFPVAAMPYITENNIQPDDFLPQQEQGQEEQPDEDMGVQRYGGNIVAQYPTMQYGGLTEYQSKGEVLEELRRTQEGSKKQQSYIEQARREKQITEGYKNQKAGVQATLKVLKERKKELEQRAKNPSFIDELVQYFDRDVISSIPGIFDLNKSSVNAATKTAELKAKLRKLSQLEDVNNQIQTYEELNSKLNTPGYTVSKSDYIESGIPGYQYLQGYGYTVPGSKKPVVKAKPAAKKVEVKRQAAPIATKPTTTVKDIEVKRKPEGKTSSKKETKFNWVD